MRSAGLIIITMLLILPLASATVLVDDTASDQDAVPQLQQPSSVVELLNNVLIMLAFFAPFYFNELRKSRAFKKRSKDENGTRAAIQHIKEHMITKTQLDEKFEGMEKHCKTVSGAINKQVAANAKNLFNLAKNGGKGK